MLKMTLCCEISISGVEWIRGEWSDLGKSGVIWGRVEWSGGELSDLRESGVIYVIASVCCLWALLPELKWMNEFKGERSELGESGVIWGRVEWSGGEWSDLRESGVIWGRVEWFKGEWSELGESGVIRGRVEWSRGESLGSVGRNKPP